ncbi:hypothetical protein Airi01_004770 [Actinoallomurus iriomotensis]|uniref:Uncharacterized protein n=1 Tax=Actinoallomurus iriomotensis TaxID=478107 RepID=A0A9W6RCH9_9ACTN|nr:hypothetical protein Airi01_004770 [Actinoallomurus iriomotensis]
MISVADPVVRPSRRATAARVTPGSRRISSSTASAPRQRALRARTEPDRFAGLAIDTTPSFMLAARVYYGEAL